MAAQADILVLGATGFTGRLITRYLYAHPAFAHSPSASQSEVATPSSSTNLNIDSSFKFTFALGARSLTKLRETVAEPLALIKEVPLVEVDVLKVEDLERAFGISGDGSKKVKVVVSAVGPFWKYGTEVVRTCAKYGIHYVDTTGETPWLMDIIEQFDYLATKTHSIIIPSCGLDSIPADLSVYLSAKTLKAHAASQGHGANNSLQIGDSVSSFRMRGALSGGTLQTILSMLDEMPKEKLMKSSGDYSLSPVKGIPNPRPKLLYTLPRIAGVPRIFGSVSFFAPGDRAIVHRSWGLLEQHKVTNSHQQDDAVLSYGPNMTYDEFIEMPNRFVATVVSLGLMFGAGLVFALKPLRWFLKRFGTQSGSGPSEQTMQNGTITVTNITTTDSSVSPPVQVKTIIKGKGDPGYLLTSIMTAESALSILSLLPSHQILGQGPKMSALARQGGILTPMTALGDVLVDRLERSGRFVFESEVVGEGKKVR